mgnify:FL=1
MNCSFLCCQSRFSHRFGYGRMRMDCRNNILYGRFHTDGQRTFTNQICCSGAKNMYPQNLFIFCPDDELNAANRRS